MIDVKMVDFGDGGDICFNGNDIVGTNGFRNMVYIGLFGGNVQESTKVYLESEQHFDWWGNSLLMESEPDIQFNSETERLLNNVALTSSTRIEIENTVASDLDFMTQFANVDVQVSIVSSDRLKILVSLTELGNSENKEFEFVWDATKKELISDECGCLKPVIDPGNIVTWNSVTLISNYEPGDILTYNGDVLLTL